MKEQIEEMIERVRKVTDDCQNCNLYAERLCDYNCDVCETIQLACEALYNAGYRKQKEGEWIYKFTLDGDKFYECSVCGRQAIINSLCNQERNASEFYPYCHCGAKMKGESK